MWELLLEQGYSKTYPQGSKKGISGIDRIESFEVTVIVCLLFTGFKREKVTVGMVPTDQGNAGPEGLDTYRVLLTIFASGFFIHGTLISGSFQRYVFSIRDSQHITPDQMKGSGILVGIAFEHAHAEHLFFTGFKREEEAVSMVGTDICKTALQGLEPDGLLPAIFALLLLNHDHVLSIFS